MGNDTFIYYPNMLKLFYDCPLKYYFKYVEQINLPTLDKSFETGKNIHALASFYLKGENITKFEQALTSEESIIWNTLKQIPYFNYDVIGIEKNLMAKIGEYWFGGRIDAITKYNEDYYIIDYKTGGVKEDMTYDPQTMIYLMLCSASFENYEKLSFVYIDLKNNKEVQTTLTSELKEEYLKRLKNSVNEIIRFNPKKYTPKKACSCDYSKICPSN